MFISLFLNLQFLKSSLKKRFKASPSISSSFKFDNDFEFVIESLFLRKSMTSSIVQLADILSLFLISSLSSSFSPFIFPSLSFSFLSFSSFLSSIFSLLLSSPF